MAHSRKFGALTITTKMKLRTLNIPLPFRGYQLSRSCWSQQERGIGIIGLIWLGSDDCCESYMHLVRCGGARAYIETPRTFLLSMRSGQLSGWVKKTRGSTKKLATCQNSNSKKEKTQRKWGWAWSPLCTLRVLYQINERCIEISTPFCRFATPPKALPVRGRQMWFIYHGLSNTIATHKSGDGGRAGLILGGRLSWMISCECWIRILLSLDIQYSLCDCLLFVLLNTPLVCRCIFESICDQ